MYQMKFFLRSALILYAALFSTVWTSGTAGKDKSFTIAVKNKCWAKFPAVEGRDPTRWRHDAVGNIVCFTLRGCCGCLCHEYDHIVPFSKGGGSVLSNCQLLQQRANRFKGNETNSLESLKSYSCHKEFSDRELNVVEMAIFGDVRDENGVIKCRCKSELELVETDLDFSSDEEEVRYDHDYEADVKESKSKKAKEKGMRTVSMDQGKKRRGEEKSRPPIDSYKYPNCE